MKITETMRAKLDIVSTAAIPSEPEEVALRTFGTPPEGWQIDVVSVGGWTREAGTGPSGYPFVHWTATATIKLWREVSK